MHNDKDLSTWQTFRRLWPTIAPFKAGPDRGGRSVNPQHSQRYLHVIAQQSHFLMMKPGKTDRSVLVWMPLVVIRADDLHWYHQLYVSSYCISWVSRKVVMTMRRRLFGRMMGMPVSFFDKQSTGTLLSYYLRFQTFASSSSGALITVVREGASIIGLFIMMFFWLTFVDHFDCAGTDYFDCDSRCIEAFRNISKNMQNTMGQVTTSAEQMLKGTKKY